MSIELVKFSPFKGKGDLRGFLTVYLPSLDMEIRDISYYDRDGIRWIYLPSRKFSNQKGEEKYMNIIRFRQKETMERFQRAVLALLPQQAPPEYPKQYQDSGPPAREEDIPF